MDEIKKRSWNWIYKVLFPQTSRMTISFSFSFPALFLTWVFLVSTHTTLSFTSDLDTHTHIRAHADKSAWTCCVKTPHAESRLTLGCPGRPASCPGRGMVGVPGRAAPVWGVSPTWGCPTPAQHVLSSLEAQGSLCLRARLVLCWPAPQWPRPPPASFLSRPLPAWLSDQYL